MVICQGRALELYVPLSVLLWWQEWSGLGTICLLIYQHFTYLSKVRVVVARHRSRTDVGVSWKQKLC